MGVPIKLYPSAAERWCACPAAPYLESLCPRTPSGPDAIRGTAVHALAHWMIDGQRVPDPEMAGRWVVLMTDAGRDVGIVPYTDPPGPFDIIVTDDMISDASEYVALVNRIREKRPKAHVLTETRIQYCDGVSGRADCIIADEAAKWFAVIDYKNGRGVVPAEKNLQLAIYAGGWLATMQPDAETVVLSIVQPNAGDGGPPVRTWKVSVAELLEKLARVNSGIADARTVAEHPETAPERSTPGSHCHWCNAKTVCPAIKLQALATLPDLDLAPPPVSAMTDEQVGHILSRAGVARMWLDAVEADAVSRLHAGKDVPGWKLVEGRTSRKISDEKGLRDAAKLNGWPVTREVLRTLADLDKVVPSAELARFIVKPPGKPTLAPADDKRKAIESKTALLEGLD